MSSSSSWKPPSWSKIPPPSQQWHLDELKNGHLVKSHSLNHILSSPTNHNRRCITFGRIDDPSQIDIVTAHESCSRLHARIAFAGTTTTTTATGGGTPYLKDLGSGNGTFVNNRQLPPEACGKWEYRNDNDSTTKKKEVRGSRGVVVYPGDAIRFGCSTRIFVLEGPEEFERGAAGAVLAKNNEKKEEEERMVNLENEEASATANKEEVVCNWGISTADDLDDDEQDLQQQQSSSLLNNTNINNNNNNLPSIDTFFSTPTTKYTITNPLRQLYNQYQTKSYKLNTISNESKRISQKEEMGVELTDGQRNQLARNQDKLSVLEGSLRGLKEKIEEGMHVAIYGKSRMNRGESHGGRRTDGSGRHGDDYDDVDDFFDRTSSSKRQRSNNDDYDLEGEEEVESETSLVQKWKVLLQCYSKQQTIVSSKTQQCDKLQMQIDNAGDEEDAFFIQNDLNLVKDDAKKATFRLDEIEHELKDVEGLLKIVNPKLSWDREEGLIGTDLQIDEQKSNGKVLETEISTNIDADEQTESAMMMMMMPPPPMTAAATSTSATLFDMPPPPTTMTTAAATSTMSSFDTMPPPPKVTVSATEAMPNTAVKEVSTEHPTNSDGATPQEEMEQAYSRPPPKKKRQLGPMRPPQTATGTQGTLAAYKQFSSTSNEVSNNKKQKNKSKNDNNSTTFDPRKDEWSAPSDQDGSGRTSLHDKFKGRY